MNRHEDARTTYGGALMVRCVRGLGWPATQAAETAGVSVRTVPGTPPKVWPGCSIAHRGRAVRRRGSPRAGRP